MAVTLVERVRQVVSAEDDDFFNADTILYYLNKAQKKVVNFMTQQEIRPTIRTQDGVIKGADRSLRALDQLREITSLVVTGSTATSDYYTGYIAFPADLSQVLYLRYKSRTVLRELTSQSLYRLEWGNLKPTIFESYYYITNDSGKMFQVFLPEDPTTNEVQIFYVKDPTAITLMAETLTDIPEQMENSVIYGAAVMMLGQESVKDPEGNAQVILQIYNDELQNSLY